MMPTIEFAQRCLDSINAIRLSNPELIPVFDYIISNNQTYFTKCLNPEIPNMFEIEHEFTKIAEYHRSGELRFLALFAFNEVWAHHVVIFDWDIWGHFGTKVTELLKDSDFINIAHLHETPLDRWMEPEEVFSIVSFNNPQQWVDSVQSEISRKV